MPAVTQRERLLFVILIMKFNNALYNFVFVGLNFKTSGLQKNFEVMTMESGWRQLFNNIMRNGIY